MSYDWQQPQPYPTGPFGQIGGALGGIGQAASQWLQIMKMKEETQRQNLQLLLSMPNVPPEAKQAAIQRYTESTKRLPQWMRLQWPTQQVPGPVTQPAVPGIPAMPEGTAPNAPGGALREAPATAGAAPVPEVRGPSTTQFVVPPQPLGERRIADVITDPAKLKALEARFPGVGESSVADAIATYGEPLRIALQQGSSVTQTVGDYEPRLKGTPYGNRPLSSIMDASGYPDPNKLMELERLAGVAPPTPYEQTLEADRIAKLTETTQTRKRQQLIASVDRLVAAARGRNPQQAHNILLRARKLLDDAKAAGIDISGIDIPESQDIAGPTQGRPPAPRTSGGRAGAGGAPGRVPQNVAVAIRTIQGQIDSMPPGPARDAQIKRLQAIYDQNHIPASAGPQKPQPTEAVTPPPVSARGYANRTLTDPKGKKWRSDGTNWYYWDGKKWVKAPTPQ